MTKYFSAFNQDTFCIITHNALPPSNAGIGSILNIANANDIIPAKAIYNTRPHEANNFSQNLITHTGHVNQFKDPFISDPLNDTKLAHNFHRAENVKSICAQISLSHIQADICIGYLISWIDKLPEVMKAIHNIQLSSGH